MNEMTTTNLSRLATEINIIKEQTRKIVLSASVEIGRRLKEAKSMVEYGTWGEWLDNNVCYSQSTANNLVKIYDEYGTEQVNFLGDTDSQALGNLTYTQAVLLLGIPADEREDFVEGNDIDGMSTRELQETIKAKNTAEKALEKERNLRKEVSKELDRASNEVISFKTRIEELEQETSEDKEKELQIAKDALTDKVREVVQLKEKLEAKPKEIIKEVIPDRMIQQLADLKAKVGSDESPLMIKYKLQLSEIVQGIGKIKDTLEDVYNADSAEGDKCKGALANLMTRTLEEMG